jgi:protein phosphatase
MMATTIVALHLKDNIATFGHVGDSRLYRLAPDGDLHRETLDHSIVEEEVRAGRMTPEQAANHPSKNVISRALGAEPGVEVDMRTMEVEDGTQFLLCTDGITRHVSDGEIRRLLVIHEDLAAVCNELKDRCYERGAEDNLTVIVVRVGKFIPAEQRSADLEPTISPEAEALYAHPDGQQTMMGSATPAGLVPPSRIAFPGPPSDGNAVPVERLNVAPEQSVKKGSGGRLFGLIAVLALLAVAFVAGARLKERLPFFAAEQAKPTPVPTPVPLVEEPFVQFEKTRRQVDQDPRAWLANDVGKNCFDPLFKIHLILRIRSFLYLYGRANLLTGNPEEASKALDAAIAKADLNPSPTNATVKKEAILALAAVSLKTQRERQKALVHYDELTKPQANAP